MKYDIKCVGVELNLSVHQYATTPRIPKNFQESSTPFPGRILRIPRNPEEPQNAPKKFS